MGRAFIDIVKDVYIERDPCHNQVLLQQAATRAEAEKEEGKRAFANTVATAAAVVLVAVVIAITMLLLIPKREVDVSAKTLHPDQSVWVEDREGSVVAKLDQADSEVAHSTY